MSRIGAGNAVVCRSADSKAGAFPPSPSKRPHATGTAESTLGAPDCVAAPSAASPCASPSRPKPDAASIAAIRSLAAPRAAMPISAHAPHCVLLQAML